MTTTTKTKKSSAAEANLRKVMDTVGPADAIAAPQATARSLTLAGKTVTLRKSATATMKICQAFGGLTDATQRVLAMDVIAIGTILHIALGRPIPPFNAEREVERTIREVCDCDIIAVANVVAGYLADIYQPPAATTPPNSTPMH
ncbi:MAG: hypothetical protein GC206_17125 [Alphaproteobacteria bacterium]|nr:hypothetical protein [Alphaproteobacteria bacterium]